MVMETMIDPSGEQITSNGTQQQQPHSNLDELCSLLRNDIPESRQTLLDTQINLEKVADYCSSAYLEADDKRLAFENTKNYTTHSLASVAYQINTLAYNILHMLDLQTNEISEMESKLNYISQKFQFHNEKVARRKIALLTSAKTTLRQPKVLIPANNEKQGKYIRKTIDFSLLDDIGHGVKISNPTNFFRSSNSSARMSGVQTLGPKSSMSSLSHYHHYNTLSGSGPAPTTKPPTPPQAVRSGFGTLSRSSQNKEYRALVPPIAPPQVPKNYESNYPIGHPKSNLVHRQASTSGYASGLQSQAQSQYMAGAMSAPYSHYHPGSSISNASLNSNISNLYGHSMGNIPVANQGQMMVDDGAHPPPPPPNDDLLPDPPSPQNMHNVGYDGRNTTGKLKFESKTMNDVFPKKASPPLPPPPPSVENADAMHSMVSKNSIYGPSSRQNVPEWVPTNYIEKVIAIYDYVADKDDELTFQENSVIYVTKKNDDGWFEGIMNGVTGLFPGNYVEPCL